MTHDNIIRLTDLPQHLGISNTTIWRAIKRGDLPQPITLSVRARGYRVSTIERWLDEKQCTEGGVK